jgi:hypothetical protein
MIGEVAQRLRTGIDDVDRGVRIRCMIETPGVPRVLGTESVVLTLCADAESVSDPSVCDGPWRFSSVVE